MLTFMKKDHNFDGEDSAIKNENQPKENMKIGSWQDALTLLVIAGLIAGGYFYFKNAKENASEMFARCAASFDAKEYLAAEACYDSTWNLGYITDTMELERQHRLDSLNDIRFKQMDMLDLVKESMEAQDTNTARLEFEKITNPEFLQAKASELYKSYKELFVK